MASGAPTAVLHALVVGDPAQPLATVRQVEVRPQLWPLITSLGRRLVIESLTIDGAQATLHRHWTGLRPRRVPPARKVEVQRIIVKGSSLSIAGMTFDGLQADLSSEGSQGVRGSISARLGAGPADGLVSARFTASMASGAAQGELTIADARWPALDLRTQLVAPLSHALAQLGLAGVKADLEAMAPTLSLRFLVDRNALVLQPFSFGTPLGLWRWSGRVSLDGSLDLDGALLPSPEFTQSVAGAGAPSVEIPLHLGGRWNAPKLRLVDLTTTARLFAAGTVRSRVESQGRRLEEQLRKRLGF